MIEVDCYACNSESVARVHVSTNHGEADLECCQEHLEDGYAAGLMFCPIPAIIVHEGRSKILVDEIIRKMKENPV